MKCYLVQGVGIENLVQGERPALALKEGEVLVDVKACSLNFRDLLVIRGQYGSGPFDPFIPLSDMAGVVKAVGSEVKEWKGGDRVINSFFRTWPGGRLRSSWARTAVGAAGVDGVLSEQIVYPAESLVKVPDHMTWEEAAALPVAGLTAWSALIVHGKLRPGQWVLLHGTGGVSIFAAQVAHAIGAKTILTTSSPEKAKLVKEKFGVAETVNYRDVEWPNRVKEITQGSGVDVVVDVAGGETLAKSLHICNYGARVAVIGVLDNPKAAISVVDMLQHQIAVKGIYVGSCEDLRAFSKAAEAIHLKPAIDKIFSFSQVPEAYRYLESQKHIGKVVIKVRP
jgi:NADPH:quinone reductase-like Zn-dependent oxidoreductase